MGLCVKISLNFTHIKIYCLPDKIEFVSYFSCVMYFLFVISNYPQFSNFVSFMYSRKFRKLICPFILSCSENSTLYSQIWTYTTIIFYVNMYVITYYFRNESNSLFQNNLMSKAKNTHFSCQKIGQKWPLLSGTIHVQHSSLQGLYIYHYNTRRIEWDDDIRGRYKNVYLMALNKEKVKQYSGNEFVAL